MRGDPTLFCSRPPSTDFKRQWSCWRWMMRAARMPSLHHTQRATRPSRRTQLGRGPNPPPNAPMFPNRRSMSVRDRYRFHPIPSATRRRARNRYGLWYPCPLAGGFGSGVGQQLVTGRPGRVVHPVALVTPVRAHNPDPARLAQQPHRRRALVLPCGRHRPHVGQALRAQRACNLYPRPCWLGLASGSLEHLPTGSGLPSTSNSQAGGPVSAAARCRSRTAPTRSAGSGPPPPTATGSPHRLLTSVDEPDPTDGNYSRYRTASGTDPGSPLTRHVAYRNFRVCRRPVLRCR
jgi:hypothetical protein